jgi:hypothetical protein
MTGDYEVLEEIADQLCADPLFDYDRSLKRQAHAKKVCHRCREIGYGDRRRKKIVMQQRRVITRVASKLPDKLLDANQAQADTTLSPRRPPCA